MESNISQQQEMFSQVGEEIEHRKTPRKMRKQVSHQLDEPEDGVDENRNFPNEPSSNCDIDGDGYNKNETSKGGTSRGKKATKKSSKPSSDNEKPTRKRKEANKAVPDSQAEKRPKKFSHSTRRNRRQGNYHSAAYALNLLQSLCIVNVVMCFCQIVYYFLPLQ